MNPRDLKDAAVFAAWLAAAIAAAFAFDALGLLVWYGVFMAAHAGKTGATYSG